MAVPVVAILSFALMAPQAPSSSPDVLLERGLYKDVLVATADSELPRDSAARIQAQLALLEMGDAPEDLLLLIDQQLDQRADQYGAASPEFGEALLWRGIARKSLDDVRRARALCAQDVESTCEGEAIGSEATLLAASGTPADAEPKLIEAWELHRTRLGPEHPLTANAEAQLARYCLTNPRESCRPHAGHAVSALRHRTSPGHPYLVTALWCYSRVLSNERDYRGALALLQEALRIGTATYGELSTHLLNTLGDLAVVYERLGQPGSAVDAARRAVDIADAHLGADHLVTGVFLGTLGSLLVEDGDLAGGLRSAMRAVAIHERTSPERFELAASLMLMADVQMRAGDFVAARRQLERALVLFTRLTGNASYRVIHVWVRLGQVGLALHEPASAVREFERALAASRTEVASEGTLVQDARLGRADALIALGRFDAARQDLDEAGRLATDIGPARARQRELLTRLDSAQERWQAALAHAQAAFDDYRAISGAGSVETVGPLARLAQAHAALGHRMEALAAGLESEAVRRRVQADLAAGLPERPALSAGVPDVTAQSVLTQLAVSDGEVAPRVWDAIIRSRALVTDAVAERARVSRSSSDPLMRQQAAALADARTALARAVLRGRGATAADDYSREILHLRERAEEAEFALAERSASFRLARAESSTGFAEMARHLPPRSAVIGYVRTDSRYVAFVTRGSGAVAVDLGVASVIERLVRNWRSEITREMNAGGRSATVNEQRATTSGQALRRAVWDRLRTHLAGTHRVFIVPDGALSFVNVAALPDASGAYLVETGPLIHLLSTERDLLIESSRTTGIGLLAVGNPAFDAGFARASARLRGAETECDDMSVTRFAPLPGAAAEVRGVVEAWRSAGRGPSESLTGTAATKAAFAAKAEGKGVLHLATHGFFVPKTCKRDVVIEQNPLLRAGIALAGANDREARDGGILTAAEIAGLGLDGTAWVVLSGCDTGTGDVLAGEGVLGLRRAFHTAGVRTVVASLWPVEDEETRHWMVALYAAHFQQGRDTAEAVRAAQLARIRARRHAGASTHPFYWAAFLAVGDWR